MTPDERHAGQYSTRKQAECYMRFLQGQGERARIKERSVFDIYVIRGKTIEEIAAIDEEIKLLCFE